VAKIKGVRCIKRNGSQYWYAALGGKSPRYCGKGPEGKKLAVAARSKYVAKQYEAREVSAGMKVKKVEFKTVKDMINWYMQLPKVQNQKSYNRKSNACVHLLDYFGRYAVHGIESDDIERYRESRKAAPNTLNVEVATLSAIYNEARKAKKIHADMLPGEFFISQENNPRPIVADGQYKKLLEAAKSDFADVLVCGYESAMRSGEIAGLRAYQVHLDKVVSEVPRRTVDYLDLGIFDTKNKTRRTVPVSPVLKEVLQDRLEGLESEDHVFTRKNGQPWTQAQISKRFQRACGRAELPRGDKLFNEKGERIGLVFHCLRHTRTTKWVEMGFSDEIIRRATGHKSLEAYQRYVKLDPSAVMRLVEKSDTNRIKGVSIQ
jgi:integrase